jgi:hypothetical protein
MSHIRIDKQKALKKWSPVLENMGVEGEDRLDWMSEYAEFHSINENAYANATIAGMGNVQSPQPSLYPGYNQGTVTNNTWNTTTGNFGSGDLGQNLLPVAMKIAAQTIGLDLVAVKPSPGPKLDLLYIDFQYDDVQNGGSTGRPQVFKVTGVSGAATLDQIEAYLRQNLATYGIRETADGLQGGRVWVTLATGSAATFWRGAAALGAESAGFMTQTDPGVAANPVYGGAAEFLGFSRIDGYPIFRSYRQANSERVNTPSYAYTFDPSQNTFTSGTSSMLTQIKCIGTQSITVTGIELISALEDHIPGFSTNWTGGPRDGSNNDTLNAAGSYPMDRSTDDNTYPGNIGPKISSKSIAVGTIEVSSALRRTEIEDIKANTGMDIVQKMESILVNELSQTISKQIVSKIFEMGDLNRRSAPLSLNQTAYGTPGATANTIFDLDTAYAGTAVGGETTHAVQRKLITKMVHASNYIATEGRVGPAQFAVTNGGLAAALMDIAGYTINPTKSKINGSGQLYPVGQIGDIQIYVDPFMKYNDNRIVVGRKNNPDQPGIIFVPYLMAQSINLISEATFAPRMLLRSRYAVAEVGWYPQKQFMTISVVDSKNLLN